MATLYDLAMQYLNQSLPKTFKYDRTNQPGTTPPVTVPPQDPNAPVKRILPVQGGGGDGFSVYNPDPNRTRNESNYSPYSYRQASERSYIGAPGDYSYSSGTEAQKFMDNYPDYYEGKQLEGIPGMIQGYMKASPVMQLAGKGLDALGNMLPVNQRAILENELLGQGFQLNDIGQFVSDGGDAYKEDGSNIMAGYNAAKVTRQTFDKRRAKAKENMTPEGFEKFNTALTAAEDKFFGGSGKATTVFNDKLKQKDIDDGFINDQIPTYDQEIKTSTYSEDEEDDILDYTNPNIYNTNSIYTQTAPTYTTDPYVSGQDDKDIGTTPPGTSDDGYVTDYYGGDPVTDAGGTAPGGGYATDYYGGDSVTDAGGTAPGGGYATDYYGGGNDTGGGYDAGSGYGSGKSSNLGGAAGQGTATAKDAYTDAITRGNTGGGNDSSSNSRDKIVCTMMNQSYGFGSFRNKIWLKHSKGLAPEYQKGYHKLFLPLVKIAKTNKVVRKILEHIAVHRTIDIRQESRGKVHLLGRVYRKILEPICYFVGKHG
ncbi:hypothetical protein OAA60_02660 [Porticoccaceae bacterium]|nr:hypothetical protein [Porticoccaceae bacterium]